MKQIQGSSHEISISRVLESKIVFCFFFCFFGEHSHQYFVVLCSVASWGPARNGYARAVGKAIWNKKCKKPTVRASRTKDIVKNVLSSERADDSHRVLLYKCVPAAFAETLKATGAPILHLNTEAHRRTPIWCRRLSCNTTETDLFHPGSCSSFPLHSSCRLETGAGSCCDCNQ